MGAKRLRVLRQQAYHKQKGRCFYCSYPMWVEDEPTFSRHYQLPTRLTWHLKCTAEHLLPRQEHGRDTPDNVVAACTWCNRMRHKGRPHKAPDPLRYLAQVVRRVALGRWHPVAVSGVEMRFRLLQSRGGALSDDQDATVGEVESFPCQFL